MKILVATIILSCIYVMCPVPCTGVEADDRSSAVIYEPAYRSVELVAFLQSTATMKFLTALSEEHLADIAVGRTVSMSILSQQQKHAIVDAMREIVPHREVESKLKGNNDALTLMIFSDFRVRLCHGGSVADVPLQPCRDLPGNGVRPPAQARVDDAPAIAAIRSLETIMADAPVEHSRRTNYLRARALEILEPLGVYRLKKASVPVEIERFTSAERVKLADLSEKDQAWLQGLYTAFCRRAAELRTEYRADDFTGHATIDGVPVEWLSKSPPSWSDLGDVTVQFTVLYMPVIAPSDMTQQGVGWSLPWSNIAERQEIIW